MRSTFVTLISLAVFSFVVWLQAGENKTIEISSDSYAAIAYSPTTGKYGIAYDRRSRAAAADAALKDCGSDDATIACWVNKGFCALALGSDKSCWGAGWSYGNGASTDRAKDEALKDCRERTTGAHIAVYLSSDGQVTWDARDNTTIIDKNGNVYDGYGRLIKPASGASASPSASPSSSETKK